MGRVEVLVKILVTGGCGFMGSNVVNYLADKLGDKSIVVVDSLTYAADRNNINPAVTFVREDICSLGEMRKVLTRYGIEVVMHMAAESSVDKSIRESGIFIKTNVLGTHSLLEASVGYGQLKRFVYISTDEVYGSRRPGDWASFETDRFDPSSPYGASKAAATHLVQAYHKTYQLPTNCIFPANNYGPFQSPEKFIPLAIYNALHRLPIPIYGDGEQLRSWLYVEDFCRAMGAIAQQGDIGEWYNIGSDTQITNLEVARMICDAIAPETNYSLIKFVDDRLGHDRRYHINSHMANVDLQWRPNVGFDEGLKATIDWYVKNLDWVETMKEKLHV